MRRVETIWETYSRYKNSGVEWIGNIPEHWDVKKLKYLCDLRVSNVDKHVRPFQQKVKLCNYVDVYKNEFINKMSFMISSASNEEIKKFLIKKNDVIITKDSEDWLDIGVPALVKYEEQNLICGYHLAIIRPKKEINGAYLFRMIGSPFAKSQLSIKANGITRYGISHGAIKSIWLILPPLVEQTAISKFIENKTTKINKAITQKQKLIELLKERKQIVIQNAVLKGLNPNAKMKDSKVEWIGKIPERWSIQRVKNLFKLVIDPAPRNNNMELISIYTEIGVKPRKDLQQKGNKASTTDGYWKVKVGDFIVNKLLAWMGAIGLSNYEGVTSPAYDILRPIKLLEGQFYHYLFRTKICSSELKRHSRGIMEMRLRLYFDKFGVVRVPFPPIEEQKAIVSYIKTQSAKIDKAIHLQEAQIEKLKEYKTILIDSAVTGKIKVC